MACAPHTAAARLLALALAAGVLLAGRAHGHAVMLDPRSRPWLDYLLRYNYNPHAVFAGGVGKVSDNGKLQWPKHNMNGFCGDAVGENKWDTPGQVTKTYTAGQTINVDVLFAQNHLGRMVVRVCPLDAKDESACKTLERAGGQGKNFDLPWVNGWSGATSGYDPPSNTDGFQTYKLAPIGKAEGCATWACDQFKGMFVYRVSYKLPAGFTCTHCKMQMYYLTASRCWPPCADPKGCKKPVNYQYCGEQGATYPEEFWNCADIKITSGGSVRKLRAGGGPVEAAP